MEIINIWKHKLFSGVRIWNMNIRVNKQTKKGTNESLEVTKDQNMPQAKSNIESSLLIWLKKKSYIIKSSPV